MLPSLKLKNSSLSSMSHCQQVCSRPNVDILTEAGPCIQAGVQLSCINRSQGFLFQDI